MEPTVDVERGAWLRARAGAWATVGGVAGTGFEAYARILHPVRAWRTDPTITDEWGSPLIVEDTRWGWAEVARRNARWADWVSARMAQPGTVFVAVGAGHLAGKGSVQALLGEKGLKVERVAY